jgi:hypothetical protein
MCLFAKNTFVCCQASVLYNRSLTVISLGQGIKKSEAGHQANKARVTLFYKKVLKVANGNIPCAIF